MKKQDIYSWVSLIIIVVSVMMFIFAGSASAGTKEEALVLLKNIAKGTHTLGGRKPGIHNIHVRGRENYNYATNKYFFRLKAFVRRSGGDRDGSMLLFSAPTWGAAAKKLTGFRPSLATEWALRLGLFGYAKRFPPLKAEYTYLIGAKNSSGQHMGYNVLNRVRRRDGAQRFVEDLPWEFAPGVYEISLASEVSLMDHPIVNFMDTWEWFDFANSVRKKEFPSLLDLAKDAVKWVLKMKLTRSDASYQIVVKARVPKVIGKYSYELASELAKHNLRSYTKYSNKCHAKQYGKIIKQWPEPKKLLDPRKSMNVVMCSRRPAVPTPTPTPKGQSGSYYLFSLTNAGNSLYIGTESSLKSRSPGSFDGGGKNYSIPVTYAKLSGPHSSRKLAEEAFCRGIARRWWNQVVPWGPYVEYLGTVYGAFDPTVESVALACKIVIVK